MSTKSGKVFEVDIGDLVSTELTDLSAGRVLPSKTAFATTASGAALSAVSSRLALRWRSAWGSRFCLYCH